MFCRNCYIKLLLLQSLFMLNETDTLKEKHNNFYCTDIFIPFFKEARLSPKLQFLTFMARILEEVRPARYYWLQNHLLKSCMYSF